MGTYVDGGMSESGGEGLQVPQRTIVAIDLDGNDVRAFIGMLLNLGADIADAQPYAYTHGAVSRSPKTCVI